VPPRTPGWHVPGPASDVRREEYVYAVFLPSIETAVESLCYSRFN